MMNDDRAAGIAIRSAGADALAEALLTSRRDTLAAFACYQRNVERLVVPYSAELNPPLWELGHIGWFQEYWIARNPQRALGARADPDARRAEGVRRDADRVYDSARIAHATRWSLPLPDAQATCDDLRAQFERTLALLSEAEDSDDGLYFFRLALFHEDMHHEAASYMAHALGFALEGLAPPAPLVDERREIAIDAGHWRLGFDSAGFAFDNEREAHERWLPGYSIDSRVVCWFEYLPFVEAGGYEHDDFWSEVGRTWLHAQGRRAPRFLRRESGSWQRWSDGRWADLDLSLPACHLTQHEAIAWCNWAGRRLPTEPEWERAAIDTGEAFDWGEVWEWTASAFAPYPGFAAHPYRAYSSPWFDGRPVLRGASFATASRLRHPRYRNFFSAERDDIHAGFRSCATDKPFGLTRRDDRRPHDPGA
jgi:ergothioneine biosynthesis protein EgtB